MTTPPSKTPILKRRIPLSLVLPLLFAAWVCGIIVGIPPAEDVDQDITDEDVTVVSPTILPFTTQPAIALVATTSTLTPSPEATPTKTPTDTAIPPETQTAMAVAASQTEAAGFATATRQAFFAQQTATSKFATSTREAVLAQRTQNAEATTTRQALLGQYTRVDIQDFVSYPGEFAGTKIIVRAEVDEIQSGGFQATLWLYSWAGSGFTTAYMMTPLTLESGVREGYKYNVYGTVDECSPLEWYDLDGYCLHDVFIPVSD